MINDSIYRCLMLVPRYSVQCDPARDFVEMILTGFFSVADVERLMADQRQAYRRLRCGPNQHVTLCDASEIVIQTREAIAAFGRMTDNPVTKARRLAIVLGSSLARMQAERVSESSSVKTFRNRDDAMIWLFSRE